LQAKTLPVSAALAIELTFRSAREDISILIELIHLSSKIRQFFVYNHILGFAIYGYYHIFVSQLYGYTQMNQDNRTLLLEQLDRKLENLSQVRNMEIPSEGWIKTIRTALNMSLTQLARRMKKTPATVKEMETREKDEGITLKKLSEAANALECRVFYIFIPKENTFDEIIEQRALKLAKEIIVRSSHTMELENQGNSSDRNRKALFRRKEKIKSEMPRYLWD